MNRGKLEVVKKEMARVKVYILGISKLRWTGMGEFNSDDHYIYYCGQESLRRNGVAAAPGKSGLHARGEGERVLALESREGTRASPRRGSAEPRPRGCSGLGEPRPALPSF